MLKNIGFLPCYASSSFLRSQNSLNLWSEHIIIPLYDYDNFIKPTNSIIDYAALLHALDENTILAMDFLYWLCTWLWTLKERVYVHHPWISHFRIKEDEWSAWDLYLSSNWLWVNVLKYVTTLIIAKLIDFRFQETRLHRDRNHAVYDCWKPISYQ